MIGDNISGACFMTCRQAEDFARDHLRYKDGRYKNHEIIYNEYWGRWFLLWEGRKAKA